MSNSTQMDRVLDGMLNFNAETKETLDSIKETIDKVFDKHYQANHTPYAVMSFENEAHYWEEQLCKQILAIQHPTWSVDGQEVELVQCDTYVIIRGNLKSGKTIHYDETKFSQLYINGERYTGNYTFNGETPETYEKLVVVAVQTPYNLSPTVRDPGTLDVLISDFPIEDAEIFVNIGQHSELQPDIDDLLMSDTTKSLYVRGSWVWTCNDCSFIKTLSVSNNLILEEKAVFTLPALVNYFIPNSVSVLANIHATSILNIDISNCKNIQDSAFAKSKIKGHLNINVNTIGYGAFDGCKSITSVCTSNQVTIIGNQAFSACSKLRKFVCGDNITNVGGATFMACTALEEFHFGKSITTMQNNTFSSVGNLIKITVSKGYHCPTTYITPLVALDWKCFLEVLENCAVNGEDGRTATTMVFKVASAVRTALTNAYNAGDETALAIYELMNSKNISITT